MIEFKNKKNISVILVFVISIGILVFQSKPAHSGFILYQLKEFVIKPLVRKIANSLENKLVNSVNKKIGGVTGGIAPSFVTNWRNHILDSQARGNNVFRSVLADTQLCPYFDKELKSAFGADKFSGTFAGSQVKDSSGRVAYENKTYVPGLPSFQVGTRCTLPTNFNATAFRQDFRNGGWDAWDKLLEPQNNFFGAYSLALNEQQKQVFIDSKADENEVLSGGGFLSQKLGVSGSGTGPTGCTGRGPSASCLFMGKTVTPAKILGEGAANEIDKKLGRVGGATELTDILLGLFAGVLNGVTNRLENYIGQATYDRPPDGGTSFDENDIPAQDQTFNSAQACIDDCMRVAESTCTQKAKILNCSVQGGSGGTGGDVDSIQGGGGGAGGSANCAEEIDSGIYNACITDQRNICGSQCSAPGQP